MTQFTQRGKRARAGEKGWRKLGVVGLVLVLIFVCQFAMLGYFNLTQMRNHVGYDSSWNFLRAALMWDEKAFYSPSWSETTDLSLDNLLPAAALLYGVTGNILLSFGLANMLMVILLLCFVWKILGRLKVQFNPRMIALNLVICPYLTTGYSQFNDLGYFSNILSGASYYSTKVLFVLMIIYEFLKIVQDRKIGVLGWILWPVCLLSGFSSGVYLIIIMFIPYIAYELEMAAIRNDWKQLIRKESIFAYLCCVFILAGKALATVLIQFVALDSSRSWTPLTDLWTNFGAVIQGFMKLLQVLPVSENTHAIMSVTGVLRMFVLALFAILMVAVVSVIRRTLKHLTEENGPVLFLVNIVLINFLIFGLFNVRYGASIFEERYLVTTFFVTALMAAVFFNGLDERKVMTTMLSLCMAGSILMVDFHSDYNYLRTTNDEWQMDEIQALAESQDAGVVYFWGDDLTVIGRSLRACDLNRIYKELPDHGGWFLHWGDYTTYDNFEDYSGTTLLVCPREQDLVPERVLAEYTLLEELNQVKVYVSDHNPKLF